MPCDFINAIAINARGDPFRLLNRANIRPDDRLAQGAGVFIHRHTSHHLPAESDARHIVGLNERFADELMGRTAHRLPPVFGMLFRPTYMGIFGVVADKDAPNQFTLAVIEGGFVACRA